MKISLGVQYIVVNKQNEIISRAGGNSLFKRYKHAKSFAAKGHGKFRVLEAEFTELEVEVAKV